jgi:hypothetical protein
LNLFVDCFYFRPIWNDSTQIDAGRFPGNRFGFVSKMIGFKFFNMIPKVKGSDFVLFEESIQFKKYSTSDN